MGKAFCDVWGACDATRNESMRQTNIWFAFLVFILNYNLPLWFITKKLFLLMVLLILGKEFVKNDNVDV